MTFDYDFCYLSAQSLQQNYEENELFGQMENFEHLIVK